LKTRNSTQEKAEEGKNFANLYSWKTCPLKTESIHDNSYEVAVIVDTWYPLLGGQINAYELSRGIVNRQII